MKSRQAHTSGKAFVLAGALIALGAAAASGHAAEWKPERNVEIIVGSAAGGPLDSTARLLQKLMEERNIGVPVTVVNRTGGAHARAMAYLNQHAGDGHYIAMALANLLTNRITGSNPLTYTDVTPLALLAQEYIGMSVRADFPFRTGQDVIERLRASPGALTFAITGRAGGQHLAAGAIMKAAGVDVKGLRFVSFKGGAETTVAVMGGHVDIVMATPGSAWRHVQGGKLRMLGIAAPARLSGELAVVPTWRELGVDAVAAIWRAVVGPQGMSAAQIAYWDRMLSGIVKSAEWQDAVRKHQWSDDYRNSAGAAKFLEQEYRRLEALLADLGDAKPSR
jgi:putative tricarboxylic transport membrane protein